MICRICGCAAEPELVDLCVVCAVIESRGWVSAPRKEHPLAAQRSQRRFGYRMPGRPYGRRRR